MRSLGLLVFPILCASILFNCSIPENPDEFTTLDFFQSFDSEEYYNCYDVQKTGDDGYIILGNYRNHPHSSTDLHLIKTDENGNKLWEKSYSSGDNDYEGSIKVLDDGGFIIISSNMMIRTTKMGNAIWSTNDIGGIDVDITDDDSFVVVSRSSHQDTANHRRDEDVDLIKVDINGNEEWRKTFDHSWTDIVYSVIQANDGGFVISGNTYTSEPDSRRTYFIIKTDSNGNEEWNNLYQASDPYISRNYISGRSIIQTNDGGYILTGYGVNGMIVLKINGLGITEWKNTVENGFGHEIAESPDGNCYIVGSTDLWGEDIILVKIDPFGDLIWREQYGGSHREYGSDICISDDGGIIIGGTTISLSKDDYALYLMKLLPL